MLENQGDVEKIYVTMMKPKKKKNAKAKYRENFFVDFNADEKFSSGKKC